MIKACAISIEISIPHLGVASLFLALVLLNFPQIGVIYIFLTLVLFHFSSLGVISLFLTLVLFHFSSPRCYLDFPHLGVISSKSSISILPTGSSSAEISKNTFVLFFFPDGRYPKFSGAFSLNSRSSWHQDKDFSIKRTHRMSCPFLVKLNEPSTSYPHWIKLSRSL